MLPGDRCNNNVHLGVVVWAVYASMWPHTILAVDTGRCINGSQDGLKQVTFQNDLDFFFFMNSTRPPPNFKLVIEGSDDSSQQWFRFRNKTKNKYEVLTESASTIFTMVWEGWKKWTLTINKEHLHLVYRNRSITLKPSLPAHADFCYLLHLVTEHHFQHRFCYPSEVNKCVRRTTRTSEMTTEMAERTTITAEMTTETVEMTTTEKHTRETTTTNSSRETPTKVMTHTDAPASAIMMMTTSLTVARTDAVVTHAVKQGTSEGSVAGGNLSVGLFLAFLLVWLVGV
nr:uncharacterized protein LOC128695831 isoform X1 [Cherax quadricarinatus]